MCGPSGSGKSTMIRCINRLKDHREGKIIVNGVELDHTTRNVDMVRRDVGMVFQQFNLFPHLTVLQNLMIAPVKIRKVPKPEAEATARRYRPASPASRAPRIGWRCDLLLDLLRLLGKRAAGFSSRQRQPRPLGRNWAPASATFLLDCTRRRSASHCPCSARFRVLLQIRMPMLPVHSSTRWPCEAASAARA
ncbi:ATP-binding cassette domain-containing protein [Bradyrhizobium betae]|uniref:ATP-binding cassette domain-containing protein n=1 Tax=Bradyrhizobium betae TaxID=244734 RepID=UPI0032E3D4E3